MKNIHLLPTDKYKSSRLLRNGKKLLLVDIPKNYTFFGSTVSVNIYITNDEEIKEGDLGTDGTLLGYYGFDEDGCPILKNTKNNKVYEFGLAPYAKKIILTTDQDLIKDGVQAIDDEFLEWFVKNPSCEEIDVWINKFYGNKKEMLFNVYGKYKIIIPKQEQSTKDRILSETPDEVKQRVRDRANSLVNNRETIEEGFNRIHNSMDFSEFDFASFKLGVKWQQEEDKDKFNKEDLREAYRCGEIYDMTSFDDWFEQLTKVKQTSS